MGGKIVSEESRGTKSKTLFLMLCYQNPMDNVCSENIELFSMLQRSRLS